MAEAAAAYSGQGSVGLVGSQVVALFQCDPGDELVTAMWPSISRGDLPTLLIVLAARLAELPDFALARLDAEGATVFARGAIRVEVFQNDRPLETFIAGPRTTWHEKSFAQADRVHLSASDTTAGPALPLLGGVVRCGWLDFGAAISPTERPLPPPSTAQLRPLSSLSPLPQRGSQPEPSGSLQPFSAQSSVTQQWSDPEAPVLPEQLRTRLETPSVADERRVAPPPDRPLHTFMGMATRAGDTEAATVRPAPQTPQFPAVKCPRLHHNEPATPACRVCHLPIDTDADQTSIPQPSLGWLHRIGTRERWELCTPFLLIGRSPGPNRLEQTAVTLDGVGPGVADLHVELRLRGFRVEVLDHAGRGAAVVVNPDGKPVRLEPGAPMRLLENGRITLANEVTLAFEVDG